MVPQIAQLWGCCHSYLDGSLRIVEHQLSSVEVTRGLLVLFQQHAGHTRGYVLNAPHISFRGSSNTVRHPRGRRLRVNGCTGCRMLGLPPDPHAAVEEGRAAQLAAHLQQLEPPRLPTRLFLA
ncbi:hypothetical protein Vretifemale_9384 [Volvox reticuliferus]|uniref:Uncharacterized protein n=1 Tax=Volvox reticuliferus TaxID=1737510 RepID=A0A8J4CCS2_9CHLO|nr:hypothetical protein Vretifemale_9384 [Volvox reticuliferus]